MRRPRRAPPDRRRNRSHGGASVHAGHRLRDRGPVRAGDHRDRALRAPACRTQHGSVLPRRQVAPLVHAQPVECVRHVRHLRDDVARRAVRGLRAEEHLDTLALAGVQPDLPDGLSLDLVASLQRADRRRVDRDQVRQGDRRRALSVRGHRVCGAERTRLPGLRVLRDRQIHRDLPPLVDRCALRAVRRRPSPGREPVRGGRLQRSPPSTRFSAGCSASSGPTCCSSR